MDWYIQIIAFNGELLGRVQRNTSFSSGTIVMGAWSLEKADEIATHLNYGSNATTAGVVIKKGVKL